VRQDQAIVEITEIAVTQHKYDAAGRCKGTNESPAERVLNVEGPQRDEPPVLIPGSRMQPRQLLASHLSGALNFHVESR
jgi:hypothetical protein